MFSRFFNKNPKSDSRLQVGLLLTITIFDETLMEEEQTILKSRIAEIRDEEIAIEMPIEEGSGKMRFFPKDTEITADFFEEEGIKYSFSSKVTGKASDNIPLLLIVKPKESSITKIQRRDYLRVPINLSLAVILQEPVEVIDVETFDLSGGGLSFSSSKPLTLSTGQMIAGILKLPHVKTGVEDVRFSGIVVRVLKPNERRSVHLIAIQFDEIEERDRDRIIRLCLQRDMELKRLNS